MNTKFKAQHTAGLKSFENRIRTRSIYISLTHIHTLAWLTEYTDEETVALEALRMTFPVVRPPGWVWPDEVIKWYLEKESTHGVWEHNLYRLTVDTTGSKVIGEPE